MKNNNTKYIVDCINRQISPENRSAVRQVIIDRQVTPIALEAVARRLEEDSCTPQVAAELGAIVGELGKCLAERSAGVASDIKLPEGIIDMPKQLSETRNELRRLEDKVDTLAPYQLWKVAVIVSLACVVCAVASWNIRPVYKKWERDQQQREGR